MFWGIFFMCLAVVILVMAVIGARNPSQPKWANALMVQYVWGIIIVALIGTGFSLVALAMVSDTSIAVQEYLLSLATTAVTAIFVKLIGVKKRLATYANGRQVA